MPCELFDRVLLQIGFPRGTRPVISAESMLRDRIFQTPAFQPPKRTICISMARAWRFELFPLTIDGTEAVV